MRFAALIAACAFIVAGINNSGEADSPSMQPVKVAWNLPQVIKNQTQVLDCSSGQCQIRSLKMNDLSVTDCPNGQCPTPARASAPIKVDGRIDPVTSLPASFAPVATYQVSSAPVYSHVHKQPVRRVVRYVRANRPVRSVVRRVATAPFRVVRGIAQRLRARAACGF